MLMWAQLLSLYEKFHGGSEHFVERNFAGTVVIKLCNSCWKVYPSKFPTIR